MSEVLTINTPMPAWYDPLEDDAEAAVRELATEATGAEVLDVELADTTVTLDGPVWTWTVRLAATVGPTS